MGICVIVLAYFLSSFLFQSVYQSVSKGIMATVIFMQALAVGLAEISSLWSGYSYVTVLLFRIGVCTVLLAKLKGRKLELGYPSKHWRSLGFRGQLLVGICAVAVILTLLRALLYPSQNVDSLMYHLSRAALYYKNGSIHNFPAQYAWALYTGPLSAILMAQQMILMHGNDLLCNLVQFPSWLAMAAGVYVLSRWIGANRNWSMLTACMALLLPQAVLQAATTQTDLLAASCCVVAVAFLVMGKQQGGYLNWILAGCAGGQAMLAKVSSGIILLPFLVWFSVDFFLRKRCSWRRKINAAILLLLFSVSMVGGFWVRNAIDLEGDFLAFGVSSSMSDIQAPVAANILGRVVVNTAICMGSANRLWSEAIDRVAQGIYSVLGANEIAVSDITCYANYISHDEQPYPFLLSLTIVGALAYVVLFVVSKNKQWGKLFYCLAAAVSFVLLAGSITAGVSSICRYIMGPVFLVLTVFGYSAQKTTQFLRAKTNECGFGMAAGGTIVSVLAFTLLFVSLFDARQPLAWKWYSYSREELRNMPYADKNWEQPAEEFISVLEKNGITKIAITEKVVGGYYPFLYHLRDSRYEVATIDMAYGMQHEDTDFDAEAILLLNDGDNVPQSYSKYGKTYHRTGNIYPLLFNNAYAALYVL